MHIDVKKFLLFSFLLGIFALNYGIAQVPSQIEQIRLQVWADLDPFPGKFGDEENSEFQETVVKKENQSDFEKMFGFAINRTKEIAPFLLSGMIYGWNYEYTPYDKKRQVSEYWDFQQIEQISQEKNRIEYKSPEVMEDRLVTWVYCDRTPAQITEYIHWSSIVYPKVHGIGKAPVSEGFEGIKKACSSAAKEAVREYWRTMIKNKPKELSGKLLLTGNPRIYIKDGQYNVDLDFFMETDNIILYRYF